MQALHAEGAWKGPTLVNIADGVTWEVSVCLNTVDLRAQGVANQVSGRVSL